MPERLQRIRSALPASVVEGQPGKMTGWPISSDSSGSVLRTVRPKKIRASEELENTSLPRPQRPSDLPALWDFPILRQKSLNGSLSMLVQLPVRPVVPKSSMRSSFGSANAMDSGSMAHARRRLRSWRVAVVWECAVRASPQHAALLLASWLRAGQPSGIAIGEADIGRL